MAAFPCLTGSSFPAVLAVLVAVLCQCQLTLAWRVLLLPLPDTGQCRQMVSIGRELKARGHQVTLFVPDYFRARRCVEPSVPSHVDIEIRTFDTGEEEAGVIEDKLGKLGAEEMRGGTGLLGGDSSPAQDAMRHICSSYTAAKGDLDRLRREGRVDLVVVDGSPQGRCLTLLSAYLGAPFVALSNFIHPYDSGMPLPTTFYPAPLSALPGNMAFLQRLSNFIGYATYGRGWWWGGFHQGNALGERVSRLDYHKLIKKASLYLENSDYIIDYPKATFPNFVQVGGLTASPAKPLPGPLARFFEAGADTGVVVVSLGPNIFTPNKNLEDKLVAAFRKLDSRVLLRLNASRSVSRLKNVQTVSWFPQNDALGHPNTRLFVSHCGKNSFFEALFHGVPLLCCHFAGSDALGTSARVSEYGVGISLDLLTASADSLAAAVTTLLTDKAYTRRIKAASKLFHSRALSPAGRAATAIEHVLKYGGGYLRPRSIEMTFFQYAGLDIALLLFAVVFGMVATISLVIVKHVLPVADVSVSHKKKTNEDSVNDKIDSTISKAKEEEIQPQRSIVMCIFLGLIILFYIFF